MGWGRTLLLGDIGNRLDIEDTERDIALLQKKLDKKDRLDQSQEARLDRLEQENADLKLYLASLLRLLASKQVLSTQELAALVEGIDRKSEA